jgi:uncharacterized membrane protein YhaH (DUF805 family)
MFNNVFSFEGRIRRTEYGLSFIILVVARMLIATVLMSGSLNSSINPAYFIFQIPLLWFFWAQGAKRCHDVGLSGWFQLIPFFPLYLIFGSGTIGQNKYGEDPKLKSYNF